MYFPYIRGKQFDLAALAELKNEIYKSDLVIPIVEPVVTLKKSQYKRLSERNIPFILVVNPVVGDLKSVSPENTIVTELVKDLYHTYKNYWLGFTIQHDTTLKDVESFIKTFPNHYHVFIHFYKFRDAAALSKIIKADKNNHYNVFIDGQVGIDYINEIAKSSAPDILIRDAFKKKNRNEDYPSEDFFYELHRIYKSELEYDGFGDFTIIGSQFDKGGGPAYVVAIHLTDIDDDNNLLIKHFKSDITVPPSPADPGGKFRQALRKLKNFSDKAPYLSSDGLDEFRELYKSGHFPGLGSVKKISIKHHIEIVYSFL